MMNERMDVPKKRLGRTDMNITRVGFGAWAVGGANSPFNWGNQDDSQSVAAIRHAVARGVNWIDTAPIYGMGHSEEMVREALAGIAKEDRPYVFTKCGIVWERGEASETTRRVGAPASIRREIEMSLKRLGLERIDLYQMHWPSEDGTPLEDYWQTFQDLKQEGKVRAVGLSNHNVDQLTRAEAIGHVDSLQPPLSAIRRDVAGAELPWCEANETGVIVYSPMQSGLLTGRFSVERVKALSASDWRTRNPQYQGEALIKNLALADALKPIAERHDTSVAAIAVAWTLAWSPVTAAIVGARNPAQVDGWIGAASLSLSAADLDEIASAIAATGAGSGPTRP